MYSLRRELELVEELLALERAKPPVALTVPTLPRKNVKVRLDRHRQRDRAYRCLHQREKKCVYTKCRGEHCPGGYR